MKRFVFMFSVLCVVLVFAACAEGNETVTETPTPAEMPTEIPDVPPAEIETGEPEPLPPFEGKIAIITDSGGGNDYPYTVFPIIEKYGEDKVVHVMWPGTFGDIEKMTDIVAKLSSDLEIKAIVVNPSLYGTDVVFEKLREIRSDIYVICCAPDLSFVSDNYLEIADMILITDKLNMGLAMVHQAHKLGAKTFVHYSFSRQMIDPIIIAIHEQIRQTCNNLGIKFIDATAIDTMSDVGLDGAQQFIIDDVKKMVLKYGADTAFFSTSCLLQSTLIKAIVETGAIYPQPCCPSPFHGFLGAFSIDSSLSEISRMPYTMFPEDAIYQIKTVLAERNMLGRFSTWPVEDMFMYTFTAAEYAIKWINGEVPKEGVDVEVLKQLMEEYAGVEVFLTPFVDDGTYDVLPRTSEPTGETYDNFLLMRMEYITY